MNDNISIEDLGNIKTLKCTECGKELSFNKDNFFIRKHDNVLKHTECRDCLVMVRRRLYYLTNRVKIRNYQKEYYDIHKDELKHKSIKKYLRKR